MRGLGLLGFVNYSYEFSFIFTFEIDSRIQVAEKGMNKYPSKNLHT